MDRSPGLLADCNPTRTAATLPPRLLSAQGAATATRSIAHAFLPTRIVRTASSRPYRDAGRASRGSSMSRSSSADVPTVTQELISLLCPVLRQRLVRPVRSSMCTTHSQPFCSRALPVLRVERRCADGPEAARDVSADRGRAAASDARAGGGAPACSGSCAAASSCSLEEAAGQAVLYRCPLCDVLFTEAQLELDVPLVLFLTEHPQVEQAAVHAMPTGGRRYRRAPRTPAVRLPPRSLISKRAKPSVQESEQRASRENGAGAAAASAQQASSVGVWPPTRVQDQDGIASRGWPSGSRAEPGVASSQEGRLTSTVVVKMEPQRSGAGGAEWRGLGEARAAAASAAAPSTGNRAARARLQQRHMDSGRVGAAGSAGSESKKSRDASGCTASAAGLSSALPQPLSRAEKSERRAARKEGVQRRQAIDKMKEILIRRALYEEHPESLGDCLW